MEVPSLPNIPVAPMAAPVAIEPVAFNPVTPAPTTSLLEEAYARMMAPTNTGTIAKLPDWVLKRYEGRRSTGGSAGSDAPGGPGGGHGGFRFKMAPGVDPQVMVGGMQMARGVDPRVQAASGGVMNASGLLPNLGVLPGQGVLPNLGVLPDYGVYKPKKF